MFQYEVGARADAARTILEAMTLTLALIALFLLTHRYLGLIGDAELYAVQAMARIHAGLAVDVFLQHGSQDNYTIFSPIYARSIRGLGLPTAAASLLLLFKVWLFAASWTVAYAASSARIACLAVALLMIADGVYGGYGAFRYAEDFLTARSFAEALAVTSLVLHCQNFKSTSFLLALIAAVVHPIMALPALLILASLHFSTRISLAVGALGVLLVLVTSLWVTLAPPNAYLLTHLDGQWLDVVLDRSIFLFPQRWKGNDWATNGRPLLCLMFAAQVLPNPRLRKLSIWTAFIGATGLVVAFIAGTIGHVAILIQAQTWRWMWMACFLGVLLSLPTAAAIYRNDRCGPITAMLLIGGWVCAPEVGITCIAMALFFWSIRDRIGVDIAMYLRLAARVFAFAIMGWVTLKSWNVTLSADPGSTNDAWLIARLRGMFAQQYIALVVCILLVYWISTTRSVLALAFAGTALAICTALAVPGALKDMQRDAALTESTAFADWRKLIPPTSSVYVAPAHYSAAFAWFTLQRPSYLSVDQSAGVIFSRATAMEIIRRSKVLLPVLDPDWQLQTSAQEALAGGAMQRQSRPLTNERLVSLCADPQLGFVVSAENVSVGFVARKQVGKSESWGLYDCNQVRWGGPST